MIHWVGQKLKLNLPETYPRYVRNAKIEVVDVFGYGVDAKIIGSDVTMIFSRKALHAFSKPLTRNIINK